MKLVHSESYSEEMIKTVLISRYKMLSVNVFPEPYSAPESRYLIADGPAFPGMRMRIEIEGRAVAGQCAGRWPEMEPIGGCS